MDAVLGFLATMAASAGFFFVMGRGGGRIRDRSEVPGALDEALAWGMLELGMAGATLMRKDGDSLVVELVTMLHTAPGERVPFHEGSRVDPWTVFCGKVLERAAPIIVDNSSLNSWRNHMASFRYGMERYCGAPVRVGGAVVGVVGFFDFRSSVHPMGARERELAQVVAGVAAKWIGVKKEKTTSIHMVDSDHRVTI